MGADFWFGLLINAAVTETLLEVEANLYDGHTDENRTEAVTQSKSNLFYLFKRRKSSTVYF